jgi:hypothetical protein
MQNSCKSQDAYICRKVADMQTFYDSMFLWCRRAELFVAMGDYPGAASYEHDVLDYFRHRSEAESVCPSLRVRALILAAELQSCCASSTSAPAGSVSLLTTSLALAQLHYLDYLAALVALHLANLQVDRMSASSFWHWFSWLTFLVIFSVLPTSVRPWSLCS